MKEAAASDRLRARRAAARPAVRGAGAARHQRQEGRGLIARRTLSVARSAHPAAADHGRLAFALDELVAWGERFGRSAQRAARRHDRRRPRRGQDDARAGDLPRLRRDGGRHEPDVRARASIRRRDRPSSTSISIGSSAPTSSRISGGTRSCRRRRSCWSSGRNARAIAFRAFTSRSTSSICRSDRAPAALRGWPRMITLALDAATYGGAVAVLRGSTLLAESAAAMKGAEEERLMPAVADTLARASVAVTAVERVVCGAGPGSFTSLRIAGAIAKGIASGVGCPLFAVSSLALIVGGACAGARPLSRRDRRAARRVLRRAVRGRARWRDCRARAGALVPATDVDAIARNSARPSSVRLRASGGIVAAPRARAVLRLERMLAALGPADVASWEPAYGRLAEAQVKWESAHGRPLPVG